MHLAGGPQDGTDPNSTQEQSERGEIRETEKEEQKN